MPDIEDEFADIEIPEFLRRRPGTAARIPENQPASEETQSTESVMTRTKGAKNKPKTPEQQAAAAAARAAKKAAKASQAPGTSAAGGAPPPTAAQKRAAAKAAKAAAAAAPAGEGSKVEALTDDMAKALAAIHQREFNKSMAAKKAAAADHQTIIARIKSESGDIKQLKVMNDLETPAGEAKVREDLERILKAAKWKQSKLGDQFQLFDEKPDRTPIDDRAFADGKADGLNGDPPDNQKYQGPLLQKYMQGYHEGNTAFAATLELFRPKPGSEGQGSLIEANRPQGTGTEAQPQPGDNLADATDLEDEARENAGEAMGAAAADHRDSGATIERGEGGQDNQVEAERQPETEEEIATRIEREDRERADANAHPENGVNGENGDLLSSGGVAGTKAAEPARLAGDAPGDDDNRDFRAPYMRDQQDDRDRLAEEERLARENGSA